MNHGNAPQVKVRGEYRRVGNIYKGHLGCSCVTMWHV